MIHLDTNAVLWLYQRGPDAVPVYAQERLADEAIAVSPLVDLELHYLEEVKRLTVPATEILQGLEFALDLTFSVASYRAVILTARSLTWTRDPFDRLIAAHAVADRADLLTADKRILSHLPSAFWDQAPRPAR